MINYKIDREIKLCLGTVREEVAAPNPQFCVLTPGAAELLEHFRRDYDDAGLESSSLRVSQEMDNFFLQL